MELQQKMIDEFVAEYTSATRTEKRIKVLHRALQKLDAQSLMVFFPKIYTHLDSINRTSEFDE